MRYHHICIGVLLALILLVQICAASHFEYFERKHKSTASKTETKPHAADQALCPCGTTGCTTRVTDARMVFGVSSLSYAPNMNCSWLIESPDPSGHVYLTLSSFKSNAGLDFLHFYDGDSSLAPMVVSTTGDKHHPSHRWHITSSGRSLFISWVTHAHTPALSNGGFFAAVGANLGSANCNLRTLIISADPSEDWVLDVSNSLVSSGKFCPQSIDVLHAHDTSPSLPLLEKYRSVLVFSQSPFADLNIFGDALAEYAATKGGVVTATPAAIGGKWVPPFQYSDDQLTPGQQTLGKVENPQHPIMTNVRSFSGGDKSLRSSGAASDGYSVIASWSDGLPLVISSTKPNVHTVHLNFFPVSSLVGSGLWDASTDGGLILANALQFVAQADCDKKVMILHSVSDAQWVFDIMAKLVSTGQFCLPSIDDYAVHEGTPLLDALTQYDAVMLLADYELFDADALGDVLADYADLGRGIVTAAFVQGGEHLTLGGRWKSSQMSPVLSGTIKQSKSPLTLGNILYEAHPTVGGVFEFNGGNSSLRTTSPPARESLLVASWSDGLPLVVVGSKPQIVHLNFFPPSSDVRADLWDSKTNGALLLANALTFVTTSYSLSPAPTNLAVESANGNEVTLSWFAPDGQGVYDYQVWVLGRDTSSVRTHSADNKYTLDHLEFGLNYEVLVAAVNAMGPGNQSQSVFFTTAPAPPQLKLTKITDSAAVLAWTVPEIEESVQSPYLSFVVSWRPAHRNKEWTSITIDDVENVRTYVVDNLQPTLLYEFSVIVSNKGGPSQPAIVEGTTGAVGAKVPVVMPAKNVTTTSAVVSWLAPSGVSVIGYAARFQVKGNNNWNVLQVKSSQLSLEVFELQAGATYVMQVAAVTPDGLGDYSDPATFVLLPPSPINLSSAQVTVSWSLLEGASVSGIKLTYHLSDDTALTTVDLAADATSYTLENVQSGAVYVVNIACVNSAGLGPFSADFSVSTSVAAPQDVKVTSDSSLRLTVTWSAVTGKTPIVGYVVTATNQLSEEVTTVDVSGDSTTTAVVDLHQNAVYLVCVTARSASGLGVPSDKIVAAPIPMAPEIRRAASIDPTSLELSWVVKGPKSEDVNQDNMDELVIPLSQINVYYLRDSDKDEHRQGVTVKPIAFDHIIDGLVPNAAYTFFAAAQSEWGISARSQPFKATTLCPAPVNVALHRDSNDVLALSFEVPKDNIGDAEISSYVVSMTDLGNMYIHKRELELPAGPFQPGSKDEPTGPIKVLVDIPKEHSQYEVSVAFVNSAGPGAFSDPITTAPRPGQISNITATQVSTSSALLSWSYAASDSLLASTKGFNIRYAPKDVETDKASTVFVPGPAMRDANSAQLDGLEPATLYVVVIHAVDESEQGHDSGEFKFETLFLAPLNVTVGNPTALTVDLAWQAPKARNSQAKIIGYSIAYQRRGLDQEPEIRKVDGDSTHSFTLMLHPGSTYDITVAAVDSSGEGLASKPVVATTLSMAPTTLQIESATPQSVNLTWHLPFPNYNAPITGFMVKSTDQKGKTNSARVDGLVTSFEVDKLALSSHYVFSVSAVNDAGLSSDSNTVEFTTPPRTPRRVVATSNGTFIAVSWACPTANDVPNTDYRVAYSVAPDFMPMGILTGSAGCSFEFDTRSGETFVLTVAAKNEAGWSAESESIIVTTTPNAPSNVTILSVSTRGANVTWEEPRRNGNAVVQGYTVQYKLESEDEWTPVEINRRVKEWELKDLNPGTEYRIRVLAENAGGNSDASPISVFATLDVPPAWVRQTGATEDSITFSWAGPENTDRPSAAPIVKYEVAYRPLNAQDGQPMRTVGTFTADTTFTITGVEHTTSYQVAVATVNEAGVGPLSVPAVGLTTPKAPIGLELVSTNKSSFIVSWQPSDLDTLSFFLTAMPVNCVDGSLDSSLPAHTYTTANGVQSFELEHLQAGTCYNATVAAVNSAGMSQASKPIRVVTLPRAPASLRVKQTNPTTLEISWDDPINGNSPIIGYILTFAQTSGPEIPSPTVLTLDPSVHSHVFADLPISTEYLASVQTTNEAGTGLPYSMLAATKSMPPTNVQVEATTSTTITLSFDVPTSDYAPIIAFDAHMEVLPGTADLIVHPDKKEDEKNDDGARFLVRVEYQSDNSLTISGLMGGAKYRISLATVNRGGTPSELSSSVVALTRPPPPYDLLFIESSAKTITLQWALYFSLAHQPITGYSHHFRLTGTEDRYRSHFFNDTSILVHTIQNLMPNNQYDISFSSWNTAGEGDWGTALQACTTPLPPIGIVQLGSTGTTATISWIRNYGNSPSTNLTLSYLPKGSNENATDLVVIGNVNTTTIEGLTPGVTYSITIVNANSAGISKPSNKFSFVTGPPAPEHVNIKHLHTTDATINWTEPKSTGAAPILGYSVFIVADTEGDNATWTEISVNKTSVFLDSLVIGQGYLVKVAAWNKGGMGVCSDPIKIVTEAPAPSDVTFSQATPTTFTVSWSAPIGLDPNDPVSGYHVHISPESNVVPDGLIKINCRADEGNATVEGLVPGTLYAVQVCAVNAIGRQSECAILHFATAPVAPSNLKSFGADDSSITVVWDAPSPNGDAAIAHYLIRVSPADQPDKFTTFETSDDARLFTIKDLQPRSTYAISVAAVNMAGQSEFSDSVSLDTSMEITQTTFIARSTTVFVNSTFTGTLRLAAPVPHQHSLIAIVTDSCGTMSRAQISAGESSAAIVYTPAKCAVPQTTLTFSFADSAAFVYKPPVPVTLQVIQQSQMFVAGLPSRVFTKSQVPLVVALGAPVPQHGSVSVFVYLMDAKTMQVPGTQVATLVFNSMKAVQTFVLNTAVVPAGSYVFNFAISGPSAAFFRAPTLLSIQIVETAPISFRGLKTAVFDDQSPTVDVIVGMPPTPLRQKNDDTRPTTLSFLKEAKTPLEGTPTLDLGNVMGVENFTFRPQPQADEVHRVVVDIQGPNSARYQSLKSVSYVTMTKARRIQTHVSSSPSSLFLGTPFPFTINTHVPVAQGCSLIVTARGSDGNSTQILFGHSDPTQKTQWYWPNKAGPFTLSFEITGETFDRYLPPPAITMEVVDGQAQPRLEGASTLLSVGATDDVLVDIGVSPPYGIDEDPELTLLIKCTNGFETTLSFGRGDFTNTFNLEAGDVAGEYQVTFEWTGPAAQHYAQIPPYGLSVVDPAQDDDLLWE